MPCCDTYITPLHSTQLSATCYPFRKPHTFIQFHFRLNHDLSRKYNAMQCITFPHLPSRARANLSLQLARDMNPFRLLFSSASFSHSSLSGLCPIPSPFGADLGWTYMLLWFFFLFPVDPVATLADRYLLEKASKFFWLLGLVKCGGMDIIAVGKHG